MPSTDPHASVVDDRVSIYEIVQRERVARDMQQWDELSACYSEDSEVDISWFKGTGREFALASGKMAAGGLFTFHQMGPTITEIRGRRALAGTGCAIHLLGLVDDVEVTVIGQGRLYSRVERISEQWLVSGLRVAYLSDLMVPVNPSRAPRVDASELAQFRSSYRCISFLLSQYGIAPRQDLPGMDRPATIASLLEAEQAWLHQDL